MTDHGATIPELRGTSVPRRPDEDPPGTPTPPPCVSCHLDAEFEMGGVWLCLGCYHAAGSTCAGISRPSPGTSAEVC